MRIVFLFVGCVLFTVLFLKNRIRVERKTEVQTELVQRIALMPEIPSTSIDVFTTSFESEKNWRELPIGKPNTKKLGQVFVPPKKGRASAKNV